MTCKLIYVTVSSPTEAETIAETVVTEQLAACANILSPATSLFYWEGNLCRETETVLILKTTAEQTAHLTARIKTLHTYQCPCIVTLPIEGGNPAFLDWISRACDQPTPS